ncbi:hypothetical protein KZ483_26065 [Paenibacillus sp. sptzw28]|uniref:DUF7669 domain-containing protein n=1 Tax=Paenibacillus sp. sptzw28 TaxID=715179 RepID=UPI001C6E6090|nr:hypothetical protein [Paenibacillus sp. sptzw28]QYR21133.1 hypothetical protein KZ483_26065 [Paenibacillus sp. sptzw28]
MPQKINNRINYRDVILAAVREIVKCKGNNEFEIGEVVDYMLSKNPNLNVSTIRTHVTSRCCVNATANHAVTYNDYERIGRGTYRLFETGAGGGRKLYFVDVNTRNNVLLALEVEMRNEANTEQVRFFDTNRGRGFQGEVLVKEEDGFVFLTEIRDIMTFRVATIEEFDLCWRRYVEGEVPRFRTDDELHSWYYNRFLGD